MNGIWRSLGWIVPLGLASAAWGQSAAVEHGHVTLASTTDLHGRIYPLDYFTDLPFEGGLAKISTVVAGLRQEDPQLLLIDSGDTIQGTPLAYYHARRNDAPPDPMMLAMNRLRYDSMTLGNHDFNYGMPVQDKARREAHFPWISANIYRAGTDEPAYTPYLVKEVRGIRIGILGLTTPGVPYWDPPGNFPGLEFRDPLPEARKWVSLLRGKERVDAVVVAMHMGLEEDLATGAPAVGAVPNENRALAIARGVPGIDLILMGHTHQDIPAVVVNGVLMAQAGRWGDHVVRADLYFSRQGGGPWRLGAAQARSLRLQGAAPDPAVLELAKPYHEETERWLAEAVGTCAKDIDSRAIFSDSAMLDLVQRVELDAAGADVSLASTFNPRARIKAGPVTVRELAGLYVYDNTLLAVRCTGAQLKQALEQSARFFLPYEPGKTLNQLVNPRFYLYNFDRAAGVSYVIDVRRPDGDRIQGLSWRGRPVEPGQTFRLALNNYRYAGGGGYTMFKDAPVLFRSSIEIRDLMIDWVEKHRDIPTEPADNWRIVGGEGAAAPLSESNSAFSN